MNFKRSLKKNNNKKERNFEVAHHFFLLFLLVWSKFQENFVWVYRWAQIAKHLRGRTDNEVKNIWNSCIKKMLFSQGLDPNTHNLIPSHQRAYNDVACKCNVSPNHELSNSVFTLNSQITNAYTLEMGTPIFAVPDNQPPLLQNPNPVWNQSLTDFTSFPHVSSIESTPNISSSLVNLSGIELLNHENCVWGDSTFAPFEAPILEGD